MNGWRVEPRKSITSRKKKKKKNCPETTPQNQLTQPLKFKINIEGNELSQTIFTYEKMGSGSSRTKTWISHFDF